MNWNQLLKFAVAGGGLCLPMGASAGDVIISEFLASNTSGLRDEDGDDSDWIELTNVSGSPVDLEGWHLTDRADLPDQWEFPALVLNPGDEVVVFASSKNRAMEGEELHTNFKLGASGEYLGLVRADGTTVEHAYAPAYPQQYPNISYGVGESGGATVNLVGPDEGVRYKVPADDLEDAGGVNPWNVVDFDDSTWTAAEMGLGFATTPNLDPYDEFIGAGGDIQADLYRVNTTVYLRIPFEIDDPAAVEGLSFGARYDDGFAIYINGSPVLASANPPLDGIWDFEADAGGAHNDTLAVALEPFAIDLAQVDLVAGTNVLAVHGLNRGVSSGDFLFDCELDARLSAGSQEARVYMTQPTPGAENSAGLTEMGPVVRSVTENPERPDLLARTHLTITAAVTEAGHAIDEVEVIFRIGFGVESAMEMRDDGIFPDAAGGDGVYSAAVPLAGLGDGEMIRWRVEARDEVGTVSKEPYFHDPLNSPEYYGTAALDPGVASNLPVLEWFIENPAGANGRTGTRAAVLYLGEFYDNVFCRIRGGSSAGLAKKSYKFDFNTGHHFLVDPDEVRVEEFNLNTTWTDKAYVRQPLSYEVYDWAGSPGPECFLTRVEQNGEFFSVGAFTEQVDERLLRREKGIDDDGALYKMFNAGTSGTSGVEKKNRQHESNADLSAFVSGMASSGTTLENFIFDNVDIPRQLNYLAATVLTQNNDNMSKNYYLYRDSEGSGEWTQLPWDTDLTFGSHYMTNDNIAHDGIWATADYVLGGRNANAPISPSHPFVGIQELPGNRSWNRIIDKLLENDRFKNMFRRRLQTLVDELLVSGVIDDRVAVMEAALGNDAVLDRSKWGQFGQQQSLSEAITILEDDYLTPRKGHLAVTHLAANAASYPTAQTSSALLPGPLVEAPQMAFGNYDGSPESGNQDEEFIELVNSGSEAIDLSGWRVEGGVSFDFLPGTIIEGNGSLYLSPKVATFRARSASPRGGEGLNVEGDYAGQISTRGETITLYNGDALPMSVLNTQSNPSLPQEALRITEIHFAPTGGKGFEFIEMRNVSDVALDLTGVHFSDGVEGVLSGSLAPGELGVVVSNPANFPGLKVVGTFTGALNNGGEQLTLRDAAGENILSFEYSGSWFSPALNQGYTIEIADDGVDWAKWDEEDQWMLSCDAGGSPGVLNPALHSSVYASWSRQYFTANELANPLVSGPDGDASGDGMKNLLKYAFGLDPKEKSSAEVATVKTEGGRVFVTFPRLQKSPDLQVVVEISTDLENWLPEASLTNSENQGDGTDLLTYRSELEISAESQQFIRVRIIQQ
ncbi:MAG: CotH kinase family protein [Verrucomicrobiaceae bacterium]